MDGRNGGWLGRVVGRVVVVEMVVVGPRIYQNRSIAPASESSELEWWAIAGEREQLDANVLTSVCVCVFIRPCWLVGKSLEKAVSGGTFASFMEKSREKIYKKRSTLTRSVSNYVRGSPQLGPLDESDRSDYLFDEVPGADSRERSIDESQPGRRVSFPSLQTSARYCGCCWSLYTFMCVQAT